ncbi:NAD(P)/FAD-dependent oxidoreductase [Schlegelella sp. S2-27]|uniref:NAD(P)/FAD-dependent oxidoreductase n=1 Tax=Caldimonas mangrovi TaxID=2944811 RepID=A0ABT0YPD2_9BURK|nr:NAD(P)/FAD-dependent oxidoreductase [Caldimonas mangrovi]MCM5680590.1 NAD(P)/FAD-dependent oxidoreductase [Caldimonas mangrovi]
MTRVCAPVGAAPGRPAAPLPESRPVAPMRQDVRDADGGGRRSRRSAWASGQQRTAGQHRIVIVGGGAGGLELATRLGDGVGRRGRAEVLLIDTALTHVWKPMLHELAAGTLRAQESEVDFLQQARRHGFRFHLGTLESLERSHKQVWLAPLIDEEGEQIAPRRAIGYDTLVIAVGSVVNDFRTPGVPEHALALDSANDAHRFHRRLLAACMRAELRDQGPVDIVIVGGGATGVELAAELSEAVSEIASYGSRLAALPSPVRLTVVEAGPRLLAALPEAIAREVHEDLRGLGIDVRVQQRVTAVEADRVLLASGVGLPADLTVWAAGIQGPDVLERLDGLELNQQRQLVVRPTLQATLDDDVFAFGDCASCVPVPGGAPVPPRAQAAHQEAKLLAQGLEQRLAGRTLPVFRFHEQGAIVSLGRRNAVGRLVGSVTGRAWTIEGWIARTTYWMLYRRHLATLHGVTRTALATLGGWLAGRAQPRVKLH